MKIGLLQIVMNNTTFQSFLSTLFSILLIKKILIFNTIHRYFENFKSTNLYNQVFKIANQNYKTGLKNRRLHVRFFIGPIQNIFDYNFVERVANCFKIKTIYRVSRKY